MSGRVTAVFGGIVLIALAGLDYGAAANSRPEGRSLGVAEHVLDRFAQAKMAMGFAPTPAAAPVTSVGQAMAAIQSTLQPASGETPPDLAAAVGSGDPEAMAAAVETEFARVAAEIEGVAPGAAPKPGRSRPGQITVGIGTCAKRGAGTFCSVGD